jgi:hypothetical protein
MKQPTSQGFVLAFHCVPWDVEPAIENFWRQLRKRLQDQGQELLLVSTAPLHDPDLPYLGIPFYLPDFGLQNATNSFATNHPLMVRMLQDWYELPRVKAKNVHAHVMDFIHRLLDALQPAAVLSWQGANPLSRMVRELCLSRDIPWWATERGWIKGTLMFDLCDNNALSEVNRSLITQRTMATFRPSDELVREIRQRVSANSSAARYPESKSAAKTTVREQLGLSPNTPIWALFNHGEPHVNALSPRVRCAHLMDATSLQKCLSQLSAALHARGVALLVREHPFNRTNGRALNLTGLSNVYAHEGDLDELISDADVGLFTLSTLQFEWALRGKPLGLLCRGMLSGKGMAPQWGEHTSANEFVNDCLDTRKWEHRHVEIERRIAYLYESQLIDLSPARLQDSTQEIADLLVMHVGVELSKAMDGLNSFIAHEEAVV